MRTSGNTTSGVAPKSESSARTESTGRTSSALAHVAFINRGFGHYIRQIGNEETQILVAFNSPDYQEISLSAWLASNPARLLADNFGIDLGAIEKMPHAAPIHRRSRTS